MGVFAALCLFAARYYKGRCVAWVESLCPHCSCWYCSAPLVVCLYLVAEGRCAAMLSLRLPRHARQGQVRVGRDEEYCCHPRTGLRSAVAINGQRSIHASSTSAIQPPLPPTLETILARQVKVWGYLLPSACLQHAT